MIACLGGLVKGEPVGEVGLAAVEGHCPHEAQACELSGIAGGQLAWRKAREERLQCLATVRRRHGHALGQLVSSGKK
jgi:hypothetical protein